MDYLRGDVCGHLSAHWLLVVVQIIAEMCECSFELALEHANIVDNLYGQDVEKLCTVKSNCKVLQASAHAQEVAVHFFTQRIKSCKVESAWIHSRGHHEVSVTYFMAHTCCNSTWKHMVM